MARYHTHRRHLAKALAELDSGPCTPRAFSYNPSNDAAVAPASAVDLERGELTPQMASKIVSHMRYRRKSDGND
jgi:hypothetical protein